MLTVLRYAFVGGELLSSHSASSASAYGYQSAAPPIQSLKQVAACVEFIATFLVQAPRRSKPCHSLLKAQTKQANRM